MTRSTAERRYRTAAGRLRSIPITRNADASEGNACELLRAIKRTSVGRLGVRGHGLLDAKIRAIRRTNPPNSVEAQAVTEELTV